MKDFNKRFKKTISIDNYVEYFTKVLKEVINAINIDNSEELYFRIGQIIDVVRAAYGHILPPKYDKYKLHGAYIPTLAYLMDKARKEIKKEKKNGK